MAWSFDGANDSVSMADNAAMTLNRTTGWTVAGWYNYHGTGSLQFARIFSWNSWAVNDSFAAYIDTGDDGLTVGAYKNFGVGNYSNDVDVYTAAEDVWTHIAIILPAGTSALKTYKNGALQGTGNAGLTSDIDGGVAWLWGCEWGLVDHLEVDLCEWGKWNQGLSLDELAALAAGYSPACLSNALAWHCPMFGGEYIEERVRLAVTNAGSTAVDHKGGIIYPSQAIVVPSAAAPTGFARAKVHGSLAHGRTGLVA